MILLHLSSLWRLLYAIIKACLSVLRISLPHCQRTFEMVVQDVTLFPRALELPPPGTNYIAIIKPTLAGVLIAHSFTVILIPLLIALLYLSTQRGRCKPIFILNVITISLAFTTGVLLDYRGVSYQTISTRLQRLTKAQIRTILSPDNPPELAYDLVVGVFGSVQYILIDTILLLRLLAVYPLAYIGIRRYIGLITLPVLLKFARVINLFIFIGVLVKATRNPATASLWVSQVWLQAPYLKIEWCMQLVDNM